MAERLKAAEAERDEARAALAQACKVIDDRGVCERDASVPLPERIDRIIVDLRTDRHHAEMDAVRLQAEVDRLRATCGKLAEACLRSIYVPCEGCLYGWIFDGQSGEEKTRELALASVRRAAGLDESKAD